MRIPRIFRALLVALAMVAAACGGGSVEVNAGEDGQTESDGQDTGAESPDADAEADADAETDSDADAEADADEGNVDDTPADEGNVDDTTADVPAEDEEALAKAAAGLIAGNGITSSDVELSAEVEACAGRRIFDNPDLLTYAASATADFDNPPADLVEPIADIVAECIDSDTFGALFAEGMAESDVQVTDETGPCFADELDTVEERKALIVLGYSETAPDAESEEFGAIVDAILTCIPADVWSAAMTAEMELDPDFEDVLDADCMNSTFEDPAFMRVLIAEAIAGNLDSDEIGPAQAPLMRQILSCVSFGEAMAAEAAADGVTLSPSTIACIDTEFRNGELVDYLIADEDPPDSVLTSLILDCLSDEEFADMLGS